LGNNQRHPRVVSSQDRTGQHGLSDVPREGLQDKRRCFENV
jgi:hypothetical protein